MNRLNIQNLTQDLLTGLTYDLIKGRPYPHDLSKPLPLIPDARGRLIIPYDHFINNDLEYLKGGSSSRKYTTSITKTKAADYGHIKWIEDKIPRSTWSEAQVVYDKHAYWGTYHWGPKRQRFYGYATNMETSKDVYSKHMIIAVTTLTIMELFGYKHLEEITVQRQDDKLYKFREVDFKRLHREDIEDMLLLLVQGKLMNLNMDERFALNVALRIDGTLNHVRTSLNDIATGIQMEYLLKRKWTKKDKQRARVMIKAIDKKLKYRRSNLEVDINKKTENQAKMTKLSMEWKRLCKIKTKVRVNINESAVKPEPCSGILSRIIFLNVNLPDPRNSLTTKDKVKQWDIGVNTDLNLLRCALCDAQRDSHNHLFFKCAFSSQLWYYIRDLAGSSTTSGGALVGTFLSGSVWSNRSQLTHMEYGAAGKAPSCRNGVGRQRLLPRGQLGGAEVRRRAFWLLSYSSTQQHPTAPVLLFNRSEHRPVKAEAAGSSPVSATPDCESHRHTRAWNYTLEGVSQSLPFALAFLHLMHLGKEAKLFKSE
ncbi:hypothetical protein Tco_1211431 [Tanacetum coccineum]